MLTEVYTNRPDIPIDSVVHPNIANPLINIMVAPLLTYAISCLSVHLRTNPQSSDRQIGYVHCDCAVSRDLVISIMNDRSLLERRQSPLRHVEVDVDCMIIPLAFHQPTGGEGSSWRKKILSRWWNIYGSQFGQRRLWDTSRKIGVGGRMFRPGCPVEAEVFRRKDTENYAQTEVLLLRERPGNSRKGCRRSTCRGSTTKNRTRMMPAWF